MDVKRPLRKMEKAKKKKKLENEKKRKNKVDEEKSIKSEKTTPRLSITTASEGIAEGKISYIYLTFAQLNC